MTQNDQLTATNDLVAPGSPEDTSAGDGYAGAPRDLPSALAEIHRLRKALSAADEREKVLIDEVQHRVRNMLATIRSIYRQSLAIGGDTEEFAQHFQGRLDAIARHQTYVGGLRPQGVELEDMVRDELLPTRWLDGPHCVIAGPPIRLHGKTAELMGLAIHELATNAVKFGAVAHDGTLTINWSTDGGSLRFRWLETGVAIASSAPRPIGFGRQVIDDALPYQLGATTSFTLQPGGIDCIIHLPLPDSDSGQRDRHHDGSDGASMLHNQGDDAP